MRRLAPIVMVILVAAAPTGACADQCFAVKLKAIGKKETGLLGCQEKVATNDGSGLSAWEAKVMGKFAAFAKAGTVRRRPGYVREHRRWLIPRVSKRSAGPVRSATARASAMLRVISPQQPFRDEQEQERKHEHVDHELPSCTGARCTLVVGIRLHRTLLAMMMRVVFRPESESRGRAGVRRPASAGDACASRGSLGSA